MEWLKRLAGGLVVVPAATFCVLVAAQPALASTPALTSDPTSAYPGDKITIHGTGFEQCTNPDNGATYVMPFWDGGELAPVTGSGGEFDISVTVPPDAYVGSHKVSAACYDPQTETVTSVALASAYVQVLQASGGTGTGDCTNPCPALQLSSTEAAAGEQVTVTGDGFAQCATTKSGNSVQLLWDTASLADPVGVDGNGNFSTVVTVPAAATVGSEHWVQAACYNPATVDESSAVLAREQLTVIPPTSRSTSPNLPPPKSTSPNSVPPNAVPPNAVLPNSVPTSSPSPTSTFPSSTSSPTVIAVQHSTPSGGRSLPVALTASIGGSLLLAVMLLAGLLLMHARARPRNGHWVHQHLRAVPEPLKAASAKVDSRPGATSLSIGLEPHFDRLGNQQVKEATP